MTIGYEVLVRGGRVGGGDGGGSGILVTKNEYRYDNIIIIILYYFFLNYSKYHFVYCSIDTEYSMNKYCYYNE
jgi:hypothetical protein